MAAEALSLDFDSDDEKGGPDAAIVERPAAIVEHPAAQPDALLAQPQAIEHYPADLEPMVGDKPFVAEDYPKMLERYGKNALMLMRGGAELGVRLIPTSAVKIGVLGRSMKAVPLARVEHRLSGAQLAELADRRTVLVCAPPLDGAEAALLADILVGEVSFFGQKLRSLETLHMMLAATPDRMASMLAEMLWYLKSATESHKAKVKQVEIPQGDWKIYVRGSGQMPNPDRITSAIKGFASSSSRVFPPLPPVDDTEVAALLRIHDIYCESGLHGDAGLLIEAALSSPLFTTLYRVPGAFDPRREPVLQCSWNRFGEQMLDNLFSEEVSRAARREDGLTPVDRASPFVMTLDELIAMEIPNAPESVAAAFDRLNEFCGGWVGELDLSHTMITGSAIAASLIVTDVERRYARKCAEALDRDERSDEHSTASRAARTAELASAVEAAHLAADRLAQRVASGREPRRRDQNALSVAERVVTSLSRKLAEQSAPLEPRKYNAYSKFIASLYPAVCTIPRDIEAYRNVVSLAADNRETTAVEIETTELGPGETYATISATNVKPNSTVTRTAVLDIVPGSDIDMSIDVATNEEFDAVARAHFAVIQRWHPGVKLMKITREDPTHPVYKWQVSYPAGNVTCRNVEMYRATYGHIVTHHVGMVSGAYTAMFSETPKFVVSSRLAMSMNALASPNYYYFASRKVAPQYVVMKYLLRGFKPSAFPLGIITAMGAMFCDDPAWCEISDWVYHPWPAMRAKGYFSVFSIYGELAIVDQFY